MTTTASPASSIAIWERAIQSARRTLDPASAKALLALKLCKRDLDRADVLAMRAAQGKISSDEVSELESYRPAGTALEFLKSKARRSLVNPH